MNKRLKAYRRGVIAEYWAMVYLMCKGYRILKCRYKTKVGEIDIIARKHKGLVAIEVKAHKNTNMALHAVSKTAQKRIARTIEHFIVQNPKHTNDDIRFDVIALKMWGILPVSILHLDNAWRINP